MPKKAYWWTCPRCGSGQAGGATEPRNAVCECGVPLRRESAS